MTHDLFEMSLHLWAKPRAGSDLQSCTKFQMKQFRTFGSLIVTCQVKGTLAQVCWVMMFGYAHLHGLCV